MLTKEFLCKREVLGKRSPHSFTPPLSVIGVSKIPVLTQEMPTCTEVDKGNSETCRGLKYAPKNPKPSQKSAQQKKGVH
jgi:hypothetical protein